MGASWVSLSFFPALKSRPGDSPDGALYLPHLTQGCRWEAASMCTAGSRDGRLWQGDKFREAGRQRRHGRHGKHGKQSSASAGMLNCLPHGLQFL